MLPILFIGACSSGPAPNGGAPTGISATSVPPPPRNEVTLAFGGDVHFMDRTLALLDDPKTAFGPIADVFSAADVAMVNLETAVTDRGTAEPKEFHFRAPTSAFAAVKAAGIDAVSLANNHALDYGQEGLQDTLDAARMAGIPALGAGLAERAYKPWVVDVRGTRVAVVALNNVDELWQRWQATDDRPGLAMLRNPERALAAVRAARQQADVVAVFLHWGPEYQECPNGELQRLAQELISAGADLLVGGHQHLMLGAGWLGHAYVAYGLGNFLWWRNDALSNDTAVLWVTIRDRKVASAQLIPAYIDRETGQPKPVAGEAAERILGNQSRLRACAGLTAARQ